MLMPIRTRMNRMAAAFWTTGPMLKKYGRYFEEKATDSAAMLPESMTRKRVQPKRNPASGP